jgi:hypothetical protein
MGLPNEKGDSEESPNWCKIPDQIYQLNSTAPNFKSKKLNANVNPISWKD